MSNEVEMLKRLANTWDEAANEIEKNQLPSYWHPIKRAFMLSRIMTIREMAEDLRRHIQFNMVIENFVPVLRRVK